MSAKYPELKTAEGWRSRATQMHGEALTPELAMKNRMQRERAQTLAEVYAPRPQSSAAMYGIVATSVASVALIAFSKFYGLEAFTHPHWVIVAAAVVFSAAILLQVHLARRHAAAHQKEYDKMDEPR